MRLFEEILARAGDGGEVGFGGAKVVLLCGRCAVLENVRTVFSFSAQEIVFTLARGKVCVTGEGLVLARYGEGDALVEGDVRAAAFAEDA